jgi:hypothetical protein
MYKVQWSNHTEDEATWEREDYIQREFPELLNALLRNLGTRFF